MNNTQTKEIIARIIKGASLIDINTIKLAKGEKPISSQVYRRYKKIAKMLIQNEGIPQFFKK